MLKPHAVESSSPVSSVVLKSSNDPKSNDQYIKLFVGCLPFDATEQDLQPLFDKYGEVKTTLETSVEDVNYTRNE